MARTTDFPGYGGRQDVARVAEGDRVTVTTLPGALQRISWGAVLAGVVVSIVVHIVLSMLGLSIGAATVNPEVESDPLAGLGTGAVMWMAGSALLAMFAGGWVAGRLAGIPHHLDGALHGIVTWGVTSILTLLLLTSSIGTAFNTAATAIGQGVSLLGQSAADVAPQVANALERQDISLQGVREDIMALIQPQGAVLSQSQTDQGATGAETTNGAATTGTTAQGAPISDQNMTAAQRETNFAVIQFLQMGTDATAEDRAAVVDLLVANTNMTEAEAQQTVDAWQQEFQQFAVQVEETTRDAGEAIADAVARIAGAAFLIMLLGAFAAAGGGHVGAPEDLEDVVERETVNTAVPT